jgi:hypothetical protein
MELVAYGDIGSWGNEHAYYELWHWKLSSQQNGYRWIGITRTTWIAGGLDYHSSIIKVTTAGGSLAPGSVWGDSNDPYEFLPRDGQSVEYHSGDNINDQDKLGASSTWVTLPKTSVPATWSQGGGYTSYVSLSWVTNPTCWTPGNNDLRQGTTYTSGSSAPGYYMNFIVYYESRAIFFGCYGGTYVDSNSVSRLLS